MTRTERDILIIDLRVKRALAAANATEAAAEEAIRARVEDDYYGDDGFGHAPRKEGA